MNREMWMNVSLRSGGKPYSNSRSSSADLALSRPLLQIGRRGRTRWTTARSGLAGHASTLLRPKAGANSGADQAIYTTRRGTLRCQLGNDLASRNARATTTQGPLNNSRGTGGFGSNGDALCRFRVGQKSAFIWRVRIGDLTKDFSGIYGRDPCSNGADRSSLG